MAAAARPVGEVEEQRERERPSWTSTRVEHEVLGMTALLVVAGDREIAAPSAPRKREVVVRVVEVGHEWASWLRIGITGLALLAVVAACVYFARSR